MVNHALVSGYFSKASQIRWEEIRKIKTIEIGKAENERKHLKLSITSEIRKSRNNDNGKIIYMYA